MDINNLYAQAGSIGLNGSFKFTSLIENIPVEENPFPDYYNLGFCRHYFNQLKSTQISYNAETLEVTFNDITDYSSYPSIGIGAHAYSFAQGTISNFSYFDDTQKFDYTTAGNKRLTNNVDMMAWSMRWVYLNFAELGYATNSYIFQEQKTLTIAQFMEFLDGTSTIDFTISGVTYNLHRSDFIDDYYYDIDATHRIILFNYQFDGAWYFDGNTEQTRNYRPDYFLQSPYMLLDNSYSAITFGQNINVQSSGVCSIQYRNSVVSMYSGYSKNTLHGGETGHALTTPIIGHATGSFNVTDPELNSSGSWKIISDESADRPTYVSRWRSASIYPFGILTAVKFDDVYKNASLYRWTLSNVYGYGDGTNVWFPKIDIDTNEYLLELIQGTQEEIEPQLPLWWRIGNIQANDYTEGDKPSPTPPTAEDEITTDKHNAENSLPALSGIRTVSGDAFSTFYHLSMYHVAELGQLISQMPQSFWEALGTATDYKQSNILDYLVSLKWYPLNITDSTDTVTSDLQFGFNGIAKITFTAAGTSYKIGNINRIYDMGSITIPYRAGAQSFLDLEPYTSVSAYLPYIGTVSLQANDVIGHTITCTYIVDLTTGMCTGILDNSTDTIYIGTGKIGVDISVSGNDILTQSEKMASSVLGVASGAISNTLSLGASVADANVAGAASAMSSAVTDLATSAIGIANSKRGIPETVGSASGFGGGYTHQAPYIRVQRPAVSIPGKYGHDVGYVCNRTYTIGTLSGYTTCSNPDLSGIPATSAELDMIRSLLISGFYA